MDTSGYVFCVQTSPLQTSLWLERLAEPGRQLRGLALKSGTWCLHTRSNCLFTGSGDLIVGTAC